MRVGVNYPWCDYGWDFGLGPSAWRGTRTTPRWYDSIDEHLRHFQRLGISVVRWFILADGLTYGVQSAAPVRDDSVAGGWRFEPPPLGGECLDHFDELLRRFDLASSDGRPLIQLLPVFVDFHFCGSGSHPVRGPEPPALDAAGGELGWVKGGRAAAVVGATGRQRFLDHALDPLLRVSGRCSRVIYAWELINEPDWVTAGWHPNPLARTPVPRAAMHAFITDGAARIRAAGFQSTVGFARPSTVRASGVTTDITQIHHYPGATRWLDCDPLASGVPAVIGEFATSADDVWPDMPLGSQRVLDRLRLASEQGCPLAIPWSFLARDRHTEWTAQVERNIQLFTGAQDTSEREAQGRQT